jgi:HlyD family secretion protein
MKKLILIIIVLVAVGAGAGAYYMRKGAPEPVVSTFPITRGDIVDAVQSTGTLEAVETVDVGTQVSGVVDAMYADFNSIVKKGQVIARLDPSIIQTQIEQARANVVRSEADLDRLRVSLADAKQKLERAKELAGRQLIAKTELEAAELNVRTAESQIRSSEAGLTQARSQLNTQEVNLGHTVIKAPIDGIVISRSVDQGQTVAASMNAPVLYVLAADLTQMQVLANIDESDVGRMRPGQAVHFRVDAYPTETFTGAVQQVRLLPTTVQNVVTYQTVISVPNPEYKLKPGMTATVTIEVARKNNVLRLPSAALRFRPTADIFAALKLPVPADLQRATSGGGRGDGRRGGGQPGATGAPAAAPQSAPAAGQPAVPAAAAPAQGAQARQPGASSPESRGGGDAAAAGARAGGGGRGGFDPGMTPEQRQQRMQERLAAMSPEERAQYETRMRERAQGGGRGGFGNGQAGSGGAQGGFGGRRGGPGGGAAGRPAAPASATASGATTIDALFAPLPAVEGRGRVWMWAGNDLKRIEIRTGISDGTWTELLEGSGLQQGTELVTNVATGLEPAARPGQNPGGGQNPLMPQNRGGGPGGGRGR